MNDQEVGWLIETGRGPQYWTARDGCFRFSPDSMMAVRFARKCDAEAVRLTLPDGGLCRSVEHMWIPA